MTMSRPRVNPALIASRAALVFGLPLVTSKGSIYPDDPKMRVQGKTDKDGNFIWARESDGKSVACISLYCDACGYRLDYHAKGQSGVTGHPLGSHMVSARELADYLYAAESALRFAAKKVRP